MSQRETLSRRRFMGATAKWAAFIPAASLIARVAAAQTRIEETHPTAVALGYRHDANDVDVTRYPKRGTPEGQMQLCDNCIHYKTEEEQDGWAPCAIFPGQSVAAKGWCNVWVAKPA